MRFWSCCLVEIMKMKSNQDLFENLWYDIYVEVTLVTRTQPSGPLCLWQCLFNTSFVSMIEKDCFKVKITIITATFSIGESATTSAVTSGAITVSSGELPFLPKSNSNIRPLIQRNCWSIHNSTIPVQVLIPIQSFSTDYKCWTN